MGSQDLTKAVTTDIKNNIKLIKNDIVATSQENMINGVPLEEFIYHQFLNRIDPIEYCENILRAHLPESRRHLHENQTALIRAVCHPKLKQVAGMMSRQAGKCFAKGTKILMSDGKIKNVEDIIVGDYVMSPKGKGIQVTALGHGRELMYEVYSLSGSYTVNKSHILSLLDDNNVVNIKVEDYLKSDKKLLGYRMSRDFQRRESYEIKLIPKGIGNYYGFSINDNDHLFLLGDYTVTHNTESIACFCGYLIDNFPQMRVGIFTPRQQQAEVSVGRLSTFFQMNENLLNHKIVKLTKDKIMLDNDSYVSAVSASDQSNIEGLTFDVICLDEAQKVSDYTFSERIVPMGGGCICGDSRLQLLDGKTKTIEEIVRTECVNEIPCIDIETGKVVKGKITQYCDTGIQDTLRITLSSGKKICGTFDHPVIKKDSGKMIWERLDEINVGDSIRVYRPVSDNIGFVHRIINSIIRKFDLFSWEKVVKVEYAGENHVYDLTVDEYHSFIANGIFVHNTNAKIVQVGTPKTRNHFYDAVEGRAHEKWTVVKRDWTQCAQSWALGAIYLPDPKTGIVRPYSKFIIEQAMPKALKQEMFPNNPEVWTDGNLDIEDFKTQYMLEFIDGAGKYLNSKHIEKLTMGDFDWLEHGKIGENYVAGIDFAGSNPEGDNTHITILRVDRHGVKQKVFCKEFKDTSYPEQMYYISHLLGGPNPIFETSKIFADYTGCGAAVVQCLQEEYGIRNMEGIIFNARDRFTNSGMNMKNIMYAKWRQELENDKFQYMTKEHFEQSLGKGAGIQNISFYHRMVSEWSDLESTTGFSVNKKIEAPAGYHDDCCDADVLANFASLQSRSGAMPRPAVARIYRR